MGRAALCVVGGVCLPWFRRSSASRALSMLSVIPPGVPFSVIIARQRVARCSSRRDPIRVGRPGWYARARANAPPVSISRVVALVPANRPSRPKIVCAYRARSALLGRATRTSRRPRAQAPPAPSQRSRPRACAPPARRCSSCTRRSAPCAVLAVSSRHTASAFPPHPGADLLFHQPPRPRAPIGCHRRRSQRR